MSIRALTSLAVLATVTVLTPAFSFSQEQEKGTLIHCGERYMTVMATALVVGGQRMDAGPVTVRKSDVMAIYTHGDKTIIAVKMDDSLIGPAIKSEALQPILECLD